MIKIVRCNKCGNFFHFLFPQGVGCRVQCKCGEVRVILSKDGKFYSLSSPLNNIEGIVKAS